MWPTIISLWLALSGQAPTQPAPRRRPAFRRPSCRPRLEALEERALPSTFTVLNTGDNGGVNPLPGAGTGTLRQAIVDADAAGTGTAANPDLIVFDIPTTDPGYDSTTGAFIIQPLSALPTVTDTVVLDGYTQPGASPNTLTIGDNAVFNIVLDGSQLAVPSTGLMLDGGNSTVEGLTVQNFRFDIDLESSSNTIAGDSLQGPTSSQSPLIEEAFVRCVFVGDGSDNTIGGTALAARNLISDEAGGVGIQLTSPDPGALVEGNCIITIVTEEGPFSGPHSGEVSSVGVWVGGSGNTIGGTSADARNVISGWLDEDVRIGEPSSGNVVEGNYIGTDATGSVALPGPYGVGDGVDVTNAAVGASGNIIGGSAPGAGNLIAGVADGVSIGLPPFLPPFGAAYNNAIADNVIANNAGAGVSVFGGTGNAVEGNSIYGNGGPGILLNSANNANDNQAAPVLTASSSSAGGTTISGTLASVASTTFRIEFFSNQGLDASGAAEGQTYLGFTTVTTDANGNAAFTATNLAAIPTGEGYLTATATNLSTGDTSPFSQNLAALTSTVLTSSADPSLLDLPATLTATVSSSFGTPTGSVDFLDATTNTNLGNVTLSGGVATLTTSSLTLGTNVIEAVYGGGGIFLGSSGALTQTVIKNTGVLLLDPTGQSLMLSGNATLNVTDYGDIVIDSSNAAALSASGNASVTAAEIDIDGGLSTSGNAIVKGAVNKGATPMADPLANLAAPSQPSTQFAGANYSNGSVTLQPGTYVGGITISGNTTVTLQAGTYYLTGGGLTVSGNATVSGVGVLIYITGLTGGNPVSLNLSGNASLTLSPQTSGAYEGVVLFQDRSLSAAIDISGNAALNTTGTEYAAAATVNLSGNDDTDNPTHTSLGSQWIVKDLILSGNAKFSITADANNRNEDPNAFMAAGGPASSRGPVDVLTQAQATAAVQEALVLWAAAGLDAGTLQALAQTKVVITPLPSPYLGLAAPGVIYLDPTAAGYGWFTDTSPAAVTPAGEMDLLTVVSHELGHEFGLMDGDGAALMPPTLAPGVRILPDATDLLAPHVTLGGAFDKAPALPDADSIWFDAPAFGSHGADLLNTAADFDLSPTGYYPVATAANWKNLASELTQPGAQSSPSTPVLPSGGGPTVLRASPTGSGSDVFQTNLTALPTASSGRGYGAWLSLEEADAADLSPSDLAFLQAFSSRH